MVTKTYTSLWFLFQRTEKTTTHMTLEAFDLLFQKHTHTHFSLLVLGGEGARSRSVRPSCDAEFARALKVFYHSMTSVRGQLQRLRRHRPSVRIHVLSSVLA